MKYRLIAFSILLLLASLACATDVNANFQGKSPDKNLNTTLRLTTSFNISADALSVQSGGTVCAGDTVSVNATVGAIWGISGIAIASLYPACSGLAGEYCPAMIPAGATSGNNHIAWLAPATYSTEAAFANNNGFTQDPGHRATLGGGFYNEPVTYNNGTVETPSYHPGMQGGANVFCEGTFEVRDNGVVKGTSSLPSQSSAQFTITAANTTTHTITTDLSGVACFAALEKHPLDNIDNTGYYRLYYFGRNLPAIPSSSATSTVTINVVNNGGTCTMHTAAISVSRSAAASGTTMVKTTVHNDADAIHVLSVTSSDSAFTAIPFPINLGSILGFGSLSPASNGFNETISPGADKDLYVLLTTSATSGGTTLTFDAQTLSAACGSSGTCNAIASIPSNTAATCIMSPTSLSLANNVTSGKVTSSEIGQFNVACQDLAGATVPCSGSDWIASPSITPIFMAADNTHAQLYSTVLPPASGTVTYTSDDGIATCNAGLDIVAPSDIINGGNTSLSCGFLPPTAGMALDQQQYFALNCLLNGTTPAVADAAAYSLINGLGGSTSNESVNGATYTAPGAESIGDLQGAVAYSVRANVIGAIALAPITVSSSGTPFNCSIHPDNASVGQGMAGIFGVTCMDQGGTEIPCIGNTWSWVPVSGGFSGGFVAPETDNTHAWAYPDQTAPIGSVGLLTYTSGQATCNSTVTVGPRTFSCAFTPSNANLKANNTQYFAIQADDLRSGTPVPATPTNVVYDLMPGLGGTHTNDSVAGTTYQAPPDNTSGQLQGAAEVDPTHIPICFAGITVGSGNVINNTPPGPGPNGKSQWCTVLPSTSIFYPGEVVEVMVWCGTTANETCTSLRWNTLPSTGIQVISSSPAGTLLNITAPSGVSGIIEAIVSPDNKETCAFSFISSNTTCASLS